MGTLHLKLPIPGVAWIHLSATHKVSKYRQKLERDNYGLPIPLVCNLFPPLHCIKRYKEILEISESTRVTKQEVPLCSSTADRRATSSPLKLRRSRSCTVAEIHQALRAVLTGCSASAHVDHTAQHYMSLVE